MGRALHRSPASHGPADWEVIDPTGKLVALIQVKSSKIKGGAYLSKAGREKLIEAAKKYHTRAFLTTYERGHYHTRQLWPIPLLQMLFSVELSTPSIRGPGFGLFSSP